MIGRREREGPLMRNNPHSLRKSRIVTAVVIGVLIGCILAFFFPNGFFVSQSITSNRRIAVVGSKTQVLFSSKIVAFVFFFHFWILGLVLNFKLLHDFRWLNFFCFWVYCFCCVLCNCVYVFDLDAFTNCWSLCFNLNDFRWLKILEFDSHIY